MFSNRLIEDTLNKIKIITFLLKLRLSLIIKRQTSSIYAELLQKLKSLK